MTKRDHALRVSDVHRLLPVRCPSVVTSKKHLERIRRNAIRVIEKLLLDELRLMQRQLGKGIQVTLVARCPPTNPLRDQIIAVWNRIFDQLARVVGRILAPLPEIESGDKVMIVGYTH